MGLSDLALPDVLLAMRARLHSSTFFPKPAEIRAAIETSVADRAELAWVEAMRLVRDIGSYRSPEIADSAMREAINAFGGWRAFCLNEDDPTYRATLFKRTYIAMVRREETREALGLPAANGEPKRLSDGFQSFGESMRRSDTGRG